MVYTDEHKFYCLNCGNEGLPIWRNKGHLHGKFHRKKLYCPHCQKTLNFIEIRNEKEYETFKEKFDNGEYKQEALESMMMENIWI